MSKFNADILVRYLHSLLFVFNRWPIRASIRIVLPSHHWVFWEEKFEQLCQRLPTPMLWRHPTLYCNEHQVMSSLVPNFKLLEVWLSCSLTAVIPTAAPAPHTVAWQWTILTHSLPCTCRRQEPFSIRMSTSGNCARYGTNQPVGIRWRSCLLRSTSSAQILPPLMKEGRFTGSRFMRTAII